MIASWNPGAERLFGYTADEVVGKSVTSLFPPDLLHEECAILERIRRGEKIEHYETVRRRKDGSLVDVSLTVSPVRNAAGKVTGVSKIARDISARKKAEHERLLALQDEERRRIANELHDSTAQHLVAIGLNLMRIRADAVGAETLDILDEIDGSLEEATKELRAFTYLLHPPDLQREGLSATLGRYVEGFSTADWVEGHGEIMPQRRPTVATASANAAPHCSGGIDQRVSPRLRDARLRQVQTSG